MMGLLYKDCTTICSAYKKNALFVLIIYGGMAFAADMDFMLYAMVILIGLYTAATLSFDEASHWDSYVRTLPVSAAQIVGEKYLLSLVWAVGGSAFTFLLCLAYGLVKHGSLADAPAYLCGVLSVLAVALLYGAILLPISYKFGASKARVNVILVLAVLFFGVPLLLKFAMEHGVPMPEFIQNFSSISDGQLVALLGLALVAVLLVFAGSLFVSIQIYRKKEF